MSQDWYSVYPDEAPRPAWVRDGLIIFVRDAFGWGDGYGPIPAEMVNWNAVSQFRLAETETTYR